MLQICCFTHHLPLHRGKSLWLSSKFQSQLLIKLEVLFPEVGMYYYYQPLSLRAGIKLPVQFNNDDVPAVMEMKWHN